MIESADLALDPGVAALVGAILSAGGLGAVAAFRKSGPEADAIRTGTLIDVNEDLRSDLKRQRDELRQRDDEIRHRDEDNALLRERLAKKDQEVEELRSDLAKLRRDFDAVEAKLRRIAGPRPS